jgi:hypothetical protein
MCDRVPYQMRMPTRQTHLRRTPCILATQISSPRSLIRLQDLVTHEGDDRQGSLVDSLDSHNARILKLYSDAAIADHSKYGVDL